MRKFSKSLAVHRQTPFSHVLFQLFLTYFGSFVNRFMVQSFSGTHDIHSAAMMDFARGFLHMCAMHSGVDYVISKVVC